MEKDDHDKETIRGQNKNCSQSYAKGERRLNAMPRGGILSVSGVA